MTKAIVASIVLCGCGASPAAQPDASPPDSSNCLADVVPCAVTTTGAIAESFSCKTSVASYHPEQFTYWTLSLGDLNNPVAGITTVTLGPFNVTGPPMTGTALELLPSEILGPQIGLSLADTSYFAANLSAANPGSLTYTITSLTPLVGGTPNDECAHGIVDAILVKAKSTDEVMMHITF